MPIVRFVTELDALLDTRLGLMDLLDSEAALRLVKQPAYYERITDRFEELCGFSDEVYAAAWATRDYRTLQHSLVTPAVAMLQVHLLEVHREWKVVGDPEISGLVLEVNTHPYQLTPTERAAFLGALHQAIGTFVDIQLVHRPWTDYSPDALRDRYTGLVLYNYRDWFTANLEALQKRGCPRITLVAPRVGADLVPAEDCTFEGQVFDPFHAAEVVSRHLIGFDFIDVDNFCLPRPLG